MIAKQNAKMVGFLLVFSTFFYSFYIAQYLVSEFYMNSNPTMYVDNDYDGIQCDNIPIQPIPNIMHQIYAFKDPELQEEHRLKREKWIKMHPNFTHKLWSADDVLKLIKTEYPFLYRNYMSYHRWIQRSDVARYIVLYHYGGWYVDLDVTCLKSIDSLSALSYKSNQRVVLHETFPAGPSNDFIGVTPRHPFIRSLLNHLPTSNKWFVFPHAQVMLSTGPTFVWGRLLNYKCQNEVSVLKKDEYNKYFQINHDGSWHSWDESVISFFVKWWKSGHKK
ncbi:hypothetical protein ACF0H5_015700 [Mactra antiquata]